MRAKIDITFKTRDDLHGKHTFGVGDKYYHSNSDDH
jgi:hypothetical protein